MKDSLHLLLCDSSLWHKPPPDCLANFSSEPEPKQEPGIKPEPEPEPNAEPRRRHSVEHSSTSPSSADPPQQEPRSVYNAWLASRVPSHQNGGYITAGAQRPLTRANLRLAQRIAELCIPQMLQVFWSRHPYRAFVMVALSFVRGIFPVFKGYTHALIINEASILSRHLAISTFLNERPFTDPDFTLFRSLHLGLFNPPLGGRVFTPRGGKIVGLVCVSFANHPTLCHPLKIRAHTSTNNEHFIQNSARFLVEYQQMEQRVRLDIPTLSDPTVRDLLAESDLFVSSFQGAGGFGLLSPFDLIRVFSLISELASHIFVLSTIPYGPLSILALLITFLSAAYPLIQSSLFPRTYHFDSPVYSEEEIRLTEKQEQMRQLSLSDTHRPEVMLFGLGPWILETWATARQAVLGLHSSQQSLQSPSSIFLHFNVAEVIAALQNVSSL